MFTSTRLLTVVLLLAWSSDLVARDIYVDNIAGDDRRDGSSAAARGPDGGPVRSIGRALSIAEAQDRILIQNTGVA